LADGWFLVTGTAESKILQRPSEAVMI